MKYTKITFTLFLSLISFASFSQFQPVLFGGVDYFRNTGFKSNAYGNLNVGAQFFKWYFLAPEVGFEYHVGLVNDREQLHPADPHGRPPLRLESRFSSASFSITPKFIFGNKEAAIVFLPQYNLGNLTAGGNLFKDTGRQYVLQDQQKVSGSIAFWSFAAGVEGQFFDSEFLYFSLLLKYSLLNSEEILEQINVGEPAGLTSTGGSADGLGIGFRVYFDFIQLLKGI